MLFITTLFALYMFIHMVLNSWWFCAIYCDMPGKYINYKTFNEWFYPKLIYRCFLVIISLILYYIDCETGWMDLSVSIVMLVGFLLITYVVDFSPNY